MANIIIDSCLFISIYDKKDVNHNKAVEDFSRLDSENKIWITEHIADEVLNILMRRGLNRAICHFITKIKGGEFNLFVENKKVIVKVIYEVMNQLKDQKKTKASYTDIYSMVLVEQDYIKNAKILTYDHHFDSLDTQYKF